MKKKKKRLRKRPDHPLNSGLDGHTEVSCLMSCCRMLWSRKKKVTWGGIDPPTDRLCVFTTPQRSMFPLYHQVLKCFHYTTEKLKFKVYWLIKECEMSSCTPCHDGLLHQNHKIQTTWLYNTHGCAFQNPIFMVFYMLFRMLETTLP